MQILYFRQIGFCANAFSSSYLVYVIWENTIIHLESLIVCVTYMLSFLNPVFRRGSLSTSNRRYILVFLTCHYPWSQLRAVYYNIWNAASNRVRSLKPYPFFIRQPHTIWLIAILHECSLIHTNFSNWAILHIVLRSSIVNHCI